MNNLEISKRFPYTEEELECLEKLSQMTDEDIDFSDIPKMTKEELKRFRPARLRIKNQKVAS